MRIVRTRALGLLSAAAIGTTLAGVPALGPTAAAASPPAPVVQTVNGTVQGVSRDGVDSFLGLRYARPPVGELRWRPPQPLAPWRGVVQAIRYGNRCPALVSSNGPQSLTEDCLFLNVQRPAGTHAGARRPVYVFIHGGGNATGSSNQHDGTTIVRRTGVIVVTINYRLGVFGWFAHPALTAEQGESGNYGFQDIEAALAWVHRNIARFGGDPQRVTVGGESSGAFSVCALLAAPAVRGMFSAAIMESGACYSDNQSDAEGFGNWVAGQVGCTDAHSALSCLRGLSTQALLTAVGNNAGAWVSGTRTLPLDPWQAVQHGQITRVPLILGANRDEGRTFTRGNIGLRKSGYEQWLNDNFGPGARTVEAKYPWPAHADQFTAAYLTGAIVTDGGLLGFGGCATRDLAATFAATTKLWVYEFDHRTGPGLSPEPAGYVWGAGHAAELAYLWPSFDNGTPIAPTFDAAERRLARDMTAYWGSFVRHHHPGARYLAPWPKYNRLHDVLLLRAGGASTLIDDATYSREHQCGFWG